MSENTATLLDEPSVLVPFVAVTQLLPRYNRTGGLGVKHQATYLLTYPCGIQTVPDTMLKSCRSTRVSKNRLPQFVARGPVTNQPLFLVTVSMETRRYPAATIASYGGL